MHFLPSLVRSTVFVFMAFFAHSTWAQWSTDETPHVPNELLVMIEHGISPDKVWMELRRDFDFTILDTPSSSAQIYHLKFAPGDWFKAYQKMRGQSQIRAVQLNHLVSERETVPNDPNFGQQWHHVQSGDHDIDSDLAWDITTGGFAANGSRIVVAVLEGGGSNYNHTDLIDNHWTNPGEIPNNGMDDDNNGYIDDYNGWNSGSNNDNIATGNHGTSVSGMIGATGNNGIGGVGVNWDVDIMQVDMAGGLTEANVIAAYEYPKVMRDLFNSSAGQEGAFVVATNASWGIDQANPLNYPIWCAYYDELGASGILNCGATTNAALNVDIVGDMPTACGSDYMVSVTATNSNDVRTFSGYGATTIDLGAPGDQVYLPSGSSNYGNTSGTSFASPCVAGAIGLVYSVPCPDLAELSIANPQGAADLVLGYIYDGVDIVPNLLTEVATGGRLNVFNSVSLAVEGCGPVVCDIEDFTASASCSFNEESNEIDTWVTLSVSFSSFLCSADILCYRDTTESAWTCGLTEVLGIQLNNANEAQLDVFNPNTTYEIYFVSDTLSSDTLLVTTPDCGSLIPGCTDENALNYDENATLDDGSCEYPCEELVWTVVTDCWPEEVGWYFTNEAGEVWAEVPEGTYTVDGGEEVWSGCVPHGCHTLTLTDAYGDGMYGSQWPGCDLDGDFELVTADGLVLVAMEDPDYGDAISWEICIPVLPGCTLDTACNFDDSANADDGSCYAPGDPCDDMNPETVLDVYTEECDCNGVPPVYGCTDSEACNYATEANVDDGSCFFVAQGQISGPLNPMAGTSSSYSYNGIAENNYVWTVSNGVITSPYSGIGLLSIDVDWDLSSGGLGASVTLEETDLTGCTGEVVLQLDVLVNNVHEFERFGITVFPNPSDGRIQIQGLGHFSSDVEWMILDGQGKCVQRQRFMGSGTDQIEELDLNFLSNGLYVLRLIDLHDEGYRNIETTLSIIQ